MLSEFNTLTEAADYLTEQTGNPWTWKNVIEAFLRLHPITVHVVLEPNIKHYHNGKKFNPIERVWERTGCPQESVSHCQIIIKACNVDSVLWQILLSKDLESAYIRDGRFVNGRSGEEREDYRVIDPIPATSVRITRKEVMSLLDDPIWGIDPERLSREINEYAKSLQKNTTYDQGSNSKFAQLNTQKPKARKKQESTIFKEQLAEIYKTWQGIKPDAETLIKQAKKDRLADEYDKYEKKVFLNTGTTITLKTIQNWISSDPSFR